ncbi:hypothetical protein IJ765_01655 [Candidatus Saccharibacteria bacterium]|nr:hypothetical protein [Candidatus Saccharibacteria bacterium]
MAGPEAAKNSVDNNGGKTGWESVAAQEFRGETNINSKTGDSRTFTLKDNYPRMEGETKSQWQERLDKIQSAIDEAEAEGAAADEKKAYETSKFGQEEKKYRDLYDTLEESAFERSDKDWASIDKMLAEGKITAERADYLKELSNRRAVEGIDAAKAKTEEIISGIHQDYEDSKAVGTPEEQKKYRQFFEERKEENYQNMKRTGRLTNQEQYYTSKAAKAEDSTVANTEAKPVASSAPENAGTKATEVKPEEVAQTVEDLEGEKAQAEKKAEAEKAEQVEKAEDKKAEKTADKKAEQREEEPNYSMKEILEKGKDIVPSYMVEYWEKACEKYSVEEMRGITIALENLKNNNRDAAMKEVRGKWIEDGFVMGAIAMFDPAGIKLIRDALTEEYGAPNDHNKDYLDRYTRYHERKQKELAKTGEQKSAEADKPKKVQPDMGGRASGEAAGEQKKSADGMLEGADEFGRDTWRGEFIGLVKELTKNPGEENQKKLNQLRMAKGVIEGVNAGQKLSDEQMAGLYQVENKQALTYVLKHSPAAVNMLEDYRKRNGAKEEELKTFGLWREDYAKRKEAYEERKNGKKVDSTKLDTKSAEAGTKAETSTQESEAKPAAEEEIPGYHGEEKVKTNPDYFGQFEVNPDDPYYVEGVKDIVNQQIQSIVSRLEGMSPKDRKHEEESLKLITKALEKMAQDGKVSERLLGKINGMGASLTAGVLRGHGDSYKKHSENADEVAAKLDYALTKYYQDHGYRQGRR